MLPCRSAWAHHLLSYQREEKASGNYFLCDVLSCQKVSRLGRSSNHEERDRKEDQERLVQFLKALMLQKCATAKKQGQSGWPPEFYR